MSETALTATTTVAPAAPAKPASRFYDTFLPRLIVGAIILLLWEGVVRAFAPAYVAKPSTVALAIPKVIVDPAFLKATGITLSAVAQGLAIALVFGTIIGLLMGRSPAIERAIRHYVNGFYAIPMIVVLPLSTQVYPGFKRWRITLSARDRLLKPCQVITDQPRALDRDCFGEGPLSTLTAEEMAAVEKSLRAAMGML